MISSVECFGFPAGFLHRRLPEDELVAVSGAVCDPARFSTPQPPAGCAARLSPSSSACACCSQLSCNPICPALAVCTVPRLFLSTSTSSVTPNYHPAPPAWPSIASSHQHGEQEGISHCPLPWHCCRAQPAGCFLCALGCGELELCQPSHWWHHGDTVGLCPVL